MRMRFHMMMPLAVSACCLLFSLRSLGQGYTTLTTEDFGDTAWKQSSIFHPTIFCPIASAKTGIALQPAWLSECDDLLEASGNKIRNVPNCLPLELEASVGGECGGNAKQVTLRVFSATKQELHRAVSSACSSDLEMTRVDISNGCSVVARDFPSGISGLARKDTQFYRTRVSGGIGVMNREITLSHWLSHKIGMSVSQTTEAFLGFSAYKQRQATSLLIDLLPVNFDFVISFGPAIIEQIMSTSQYRYPRHEIRYRSLGYDLKVSYQRQTREHLQYFFTPIGYIKNVRILRRGNADAYDELPIDEQEEMDRQILGRKSEMFRILEVGMGLVF